MNPTQVTCLKGELHQYAKFLDDMTRISTSFFGRRQDPKSKALYSLCKSMIDRTKEILYLINLNFQNDDKLYSFYFQNINGTQLLSRSILEASIIYNVLVNNDDLYSELFLVQKEIDEHNIKAQFKGSSYYFEKDKMKERYDRFKWAQSLSQSRINSIEDLIECGRFSEELKELFIHEVNMSNSFSHPNLINDSFYVGAIVDANVPMVIEVFQIIKSVFMGLLESFDLLHPYLFTVPKPHYLSFFPYTKVLYEEKDMSSCLENIYNNPYDYLQVHKKSYDTETTQVDNIMDLLSIYSISVNPHHSPTRKNRSIQKLFDSLTHNVRELMLGFEQRKLYLYTTKIRYVLENLATIWILLDFTEETVEMYQAHTDIKNYLDFQKVPDLLLETAGIKDRFEMDLIEVEGKMITRKELHRLNIEFIRDYMKKHYDLTLSNKDIFKSNTWLIDANKGWNETPSNIKYIAYLVKEITNFEHPQKLDCNLNHYVRGLYAFSCTYCHPTYFSTETTSWDKLEGVIKESYYFVTMLLQIVLKKVDEHYPIMKELFKDYQEGTNKEIYSLEYSFDQIFKECEKFVKFK